METEIKCPKCGSTNLEFYAFSFVPDCGVRCNDCGFEIESEVSWDECDSEEAHDEKCGEHLIELLNQYVDD